jgi:hypothetical protein
LGLKGEGANGLATHRSVGRRWMLGVEIEDERVVVVQLGVRDPGVRIGVVAFPANEVL